MRETFADPELAAGLETSHLDVQELPEGLGSYVAWVYQRILAWMRDLAIESPMALTGMYLLMVLLLALLVTHIVWSLRQAFRAGGEADPGPDEAAAALRQRSAELRAEARSLAAQGRLREATRLLLLLLLALLDERGVLEVGPGWTNREILARLRLPPGLAADAAAFVAAADEACYGDRAPDAGAFARLTGLVERIEAGEVRA